MVEFKNRSKWLLSHFQAATLTTCPFTPFFPLSCVQTEQASQHGTEILSTMHFLSQILQSIDLVALTPKAPRYFSSVPSALKRDLYQVVHRQTVGMIGETRRHLSSQEAYTSETGPTLR